MWELYHITYFFIGNIVCEHGKHIILTCMWINADESIF